MSKSTACTAGWCTDDEWCALTCAADVLARKWHPVIVSALLARGPLGFADLEDDLGRVSAPVLSASLESLESDGIVERRVVSEQPHRVEYALTEKGRALEPVLDAMVAWGETYADDSATRG